jgi:hypothetical protein
LVSHVTDLKGFGGSFKAGNPAPFSLTHEDHVSPSLR